MYLCMYLQYFGISWESWKVGKLESRSLVGCLVFFVFLGFHVFRLLYFHALHSFGLSYLHTYLHIHIHSDFSPFQYLSSLAISPHPFFFFSIDSKTLSRRFGADE